MSCATDISEAAVGWRRETQLLYAGIPALIVARDAPPEALARCWALLRDAEAVLSAHRHGSELRRLNASTDPSGIALSPLMSEALAAAGRWWRLTSRACDANAGALVALWRAAVAAGRWPTADEISAACARGGCGGLVVVGDRLRAPCPRLALDLGGIAKGFLVDRIDALLQAHGVEDVLIQFGGETSCRGRAPHGGPWRVGVQHPVLPGRAWCALEAGPHGLSCSTSGDGRRAAAIDGVAVAHLVDPRSGMPLSADLLSVCVAAPRAGSATACEALTKAGCFLDRAQAGWAITAQEAEALWLEADDAGIIASCTAGWQARWGSA